MPVARMDLGLCITFSARPHAACHGWTEHNASRYARWVIRSFGDAPTERLWARQRTKSLDPRIERTALRKLKQRSTSTATAGLTLMGVRLYNATRGLFTSLDPIPGGNDTPYNYPSDPLNSFDLDGRYSWSRIWGNGLRWGRRHRTRIESGIVSAGAMFAAGMNRSRCRRIHGLMTCTGGRVPLYSRAGTTYGSVYFTNNERKNRLRKRINHEKAHSRQWRRHGFAFAALYLRAGRNPCRNRYEREAGWKSGGYLNC